MGNLYRLLNNKTDCI